MRRRIAAKYSGHELATHVEQNIANVKWSSATVSANIDTMDINGGWSLFPLAVLPGSSTFTMTFTSAKFDTGLFAMANAIKDAPEDEKDHAWRQNSNYVMSTGEHRELSNNQITLMFTPVADSVYIPGMEATTEETVPAGKYKVDPSTKTISFCADDNLQYVDVVYDYVQEVTEAIVTNKESAIGEAVAIWPVKNRGLAA